MTLRTLGALMAVLVALALLPFFFGIPYRDAVPLRHTSQKAVVDLESHLLAFQRALLQEIEGELQCEGIVLEQVQKELQVVERERQELLEELRALKEKARSKADGLVELYQGSLIVCNEDNELQQVAVTELAAEPFLRTLEPTWPRLLVVFAFFNGSAERWPQVATAIPYYHRCLSNCRSPKLHFLLTKVGT
jgi:hypothetical protein